MNSRLKLFFVGAISVLGLVPLQAQGNGNCALTLAGQDFHIAGSVGGLTNDPALIGQQVSFADTAISMEQGLTSNPDFIFGDQDVAILVVDDFNGNDALLDPSAGDISHGKLVRDHLSTLIQELDGGASYGTKSILHLSSATKLPYIWEVSSNTGLSTIFLVPVSANNGVSNYSTQFIADNVRANLDYYLDLNGNGIEGDAGDITRFVVNMSFTILPCETVEDFIAQRNGNPSYDFQTYYDQNIASNLQFANFYTWIRSLVASVNFTNDPLLELFRNCEYGGGGQSLQDDSDGQDQPIVELTQDVGIGLGIEGTPTPQVQQEGELEECEGNEGRSIIFIAAAGNFGEADSEENSAGSNMPLRTYPGAWKEVISVSGLEGDQSGGKMNWIPSNVGEVTLQAAWYPIGPNGYFYAGTSFAAPALSLEAALYLTQDVVVRPFDQVPPAWASKVCPSLAAVPLLTEVLTTTACP